MYYVDWPWSMKCIRAGLENDRLPDVLNTSRINTGIVYAHLTFPAFVAHTLMFLLLIFKNNLEE